MTSRFLNRAFPALVIVAVLILFFHPVVFADKTFFFRDFHRIFYPAKAFMTGVFQDGGIPYWCPQMFCGAPFASFISNAVFYPFAIVFYMMDMPYSLNLVILVHILIGFWFCYLLLTALGASRKAATFAGISFCFGGYTISAVNLLSHLQTVIWMPAILWSFHAAATRKKRSYFFLTVFFFAMALLGGAPQLLLLTAGILVPGALFWLPPGASGWQPRLANICTLPLLLALAGVAVMVQLGPMYIDYLNSIRMGGISYAEASRHSLEPAMLPHLLVPLRFPADFVDRPDVFKDFFPGGSNIPWLLTVYPGCLVLPLALWGTCRHFTLQRGFWFGLFLTGVVLALGHNTPLYKLLYTVLPSFRFPEKFMAMASLSLLVPAAFGFDHLLALIRKWGLPAGSVFVLILTVLVADLYVAHRHLNPVCDPAFYRHHHPDLDAVLADKGRHRVFIDPDIPRPSGDFNTIQNAHIQWQHYLFPNAGLLNNMSHVGGASGLELNYQYALTEVLLKPWPEKVNLLRLANVKYIVTTRRLTDIQGLAAHLEPVNGSVYRLKNTLPRAWVVGRLQAAPTDLMAGLSQLQFDMRTTALARVALGKEDTSGYFAPVSKIDYPSSNTIVIEAVLEKPGILVLSESAYPGWQVTVDGQARDLLNLNLLFQGVELASGRHRIEFTYRPLHFNLFLAVSLTAIFICSFLWMVCAWMERRE